MRIVFMGTPDFAAASLQKLIDEKYDIAAVFTQPDKPRNRGMSLSFSPVKELALQNGLDVYQPTKLRDGSFTELLKTADCGQVSVNISRPGITKGQHWHNTKWEFFIVVAGHGLIRQRRIGSEEVLEFEVSGDRIQAVQMLPGYTHNIINLSETENLVTVMWANESFDPARPDTFSEPV